MLHKSIERQGIIVNETYQYLQRDFNKYAKGAVGMWLLFGADCDTGDAYRSSYYFFRHIDDVLDNDRSINEDPFTYVQNIKGAITSGNFHLYPILSLASRAFDHMNKVKRDTDDPEKDTVQLIDSMIYDRKRMLGRVELSREELIKNYHTQFDPIINLQLIALQSRLRVGDILELPEVQARVYSLIDLEKDWTKGLINVPSEVLSMAGIYSRCDITTVLSSSVIQEWMFDERIDCATKLGHINQQLSEYFSQYGDKKSMPHNERVQQIILGQLLKKIAQYVAN